MNTTITPSHSVRIVTSGVISLGVVDVFKFPSGLEDARGLGPKLEAPNGETGTTQFKKNVNWISVPTYATNMGFMLISA